jgi:hypothetical protein
MLLNLSSKRSIAFSAAEQHSTGTGQCEAKEDALDFHASLFSSINEPFAQFVGHDDEDEADWWTGGSPSE